MILRYKTAKRAKKFALFCCDPTCKENVPDGSGHDISSDQTP